MTVQAGAALGRGGEERSGVMLCHPTNTCEKQPVLHLQGTEDPEQVRAEQISACRCPLPCKHPQAAAWQPAATENSGAAAGPVAHL